MTWKDALPSDQQDINMYHVHEFFETMYQRQEVWFNRFALQQPAPWTDNKIFREYKFTNVYRELDRCSQWEIENVIKTTPDFINKAWKICLYRFMVNPNFFEYIGGVPDYEDYDAEKFYKQIGEYRATGNNPFTSAYLVNSGKYPNVGRDEFYGRYSVPNLHKHIKGLFGKMSKYKGDPVAFIKALTQLDGIGMFVAHEMYISLCYIAKYTDDHTFPWNQMSWTNVGPGCSSGIRIVLPNLRGYKQQWEGIHLLQAMAAPYLKENFPDFKFITYNKVKGEYVISKKCTITLHQIEMWLCEYQKYFKMTLQMGKQRSRFSATNKKLNY